MSSSIAEVPATIDGINEMLADPRVLVLSNVRLFMCEKGSFPKDTELRQLLDPLTGLPYPLLPPDEELPLDDETTDFHHGFHPHCHPTLKTLGGRALRSAQLQLVRRDQHNHTEEAYHRFEVGPWIHRDVGHQMGAALLAAAGCAHRVGLTVVDGALWMQPMTERQSASLRVQASPVEVGVADVEVFRERMHLGDMAEEEVIALLTAHRERDAAMTYRNLRTGYDQTRDLFMAYVFKQDLSNISRKTINKFKNSGDNELGHRLLVQAAYELVRSAVTYNGQTLHDLYGDLHEAGMLNPNVPQRAGDLVKVKLGSIERRISLLPQFRAELIRRQEAA